MLKVKYKWAYYFLNQRIWSKLYSGEEENLNKHDQNKHGKLTL